MIAQARTKSNQLIPDFSISKHMVILSSFNKNAAQWNLISRPECITYELLASCRVENQKRAWETTYLVLSLTKQVQRYISIQPSDGSI